MFSYRNCAMCECALGSEILTKILVACCNLIISTQFYPEIWLKKLNIMHEKGKGQLIVKLRTIQLAEIDFQLLMRVFLNDRMVGLTETEENISKVKGVQ